MNIRLADGHIRLRLNGMEAETLLQVNKLTITVSWVTGADLNVSLILSDEAARPRVRAEALDLLVIVPRSDFIELLEHFGRKDAAIAWAEFAANGQTLPWSLEIDAVRSRFKADRGQTAAEARQ